MRAFFRPIITHANAPRDRARQVVDGELIPCADDIVIIGVVDPPPPGMKWDWIKDPAFTRDLCPVCPRTGIFREMCGDCPTQRYWKRIAVPKEEQHGDQN